MFKKPISIFYSFNILAVLGLISFIFFYLNQGYYGFGMALLFIFPIYYAVTFLIFIITYIIEHIFSLEIKNKFITQNKFIAILRYIGLLIWFVPLVYCLVVIIKMEFFY